jgi:hypothetical protein
VAGGGFEVDGGVAHAGGDEQLEAWQAGEEGRRKGGAFAHRDEDLAVADGFGDLVLGDEVTLQRPYFDITDES